MTEGGNDGTSRNLLNRWTPENENTNIPGHDIDGNQRNSSRWVEDGSFIRLNNVTFGYTLPKKITNQLYFQNLRLYLSAQNLLTFTKYSGFNPETSYNQDSVLAPGTDYGMYPLARVFTFGFNLTF